MKLPKMFERLQIDNVIQSPQLQACTEFRRMITLVFLILGLFVHCPFEILASVMTLISPELRS